MSFHLGQLGENFKSDPLHLNRDLKGRQMREGRSKQLKRRVKSPEVGICSKVPEGPGASVVRQGRRWELEYEARRMCMQISGCVCVCRLCRMAQKTPSAKGYSKYLDLWATQSLL